MDTITIETIVNAPIDKVWKYWTEPEHITHWAFASDEWEAFEPTNDLKVGGIFKTTMRAKDLSQGFDFAGTYSIVEEPELIEYSLEDGRQVRIEFTPVPDGVQILQSFDPEKENDPEYQKQGWVAILNNFKGYTERN